MCSSTLIVTIKTCYTTRTNHFDLIEFEIINNNNKVLVQLIKNSINRIID